MIGKVDYYDSSDEESIEGARPVRVKKLRYVILWSRDLRNTIGNIPIEWYDDFKHIGYDKDGNQIDSAKRMNNMEEFLDRMDDPNYWRKIYDRQSGSFVTLSDEQVKKLNALNASKYPSVGYNPYQPFWISSHHKQKSIQCRIVQIPNVHLFLRWMKSALLGRWCMPLKWVGYDYLDQSKLKKGMGSKRFMTYGLMILSKKNENELARIRMHFPAPKVPLPGHVESYNPPAEYLCDDDEIKSGRRSTIGLCSKKYGCLRKVPAYHQFYNDRYQRCLDLYLAPRQRKMKLNVDCAELLPELPNLTEMRPFQRHRRLLGHSGQVRSLSFEPDSAEIFASGGEDGTLRLWSMTSLKDPITSVAYCPLKKWTLLAVTMESENMILTNSHCGDHYRITATTEYLSKLRCKPSESGSLEWKNEEKTKYQLISDIELCFLQIAHQVIWHHKGDYFATFANSKSPKFIYIHQLSRCKSQQPFSRLKGLMTVLSFHPCEPLLFVGTQRYIRIYDLAKCQLKKKVITGSQWVSSIHVDFRGDNVFVGGHDRIFSWIDLQLSNKPWKSVKHHTAAIRSVTQHARYPLIATVSDDSTAVVYYARISSDPFKENEFVPVRKLRIRTTQKNDLSILAAIFHPSQPWLLTAHVDGSIALFT
ncbi:Ribosome biogenesis protein BOP1 [Dirofilaria immitis]|nr:Ribosome biogenesis protein BOP1 [Dirofilaria immitis]